MSLRTPVFKTGALAVLPTLQDTTLKQLSFLRQGRFQDCFRYRSETKRKLPSSFPSACRSPAPVQDRPLGFPVALHVAHEGGLRPPGAQLHNVFHRRRLIVRGEPTPEGVPPTPIGLRNPRRRVRVPHPLIDRVLGVRLSLRTLEHPRAGRVPPRSAARKTRCRSCAD